MKVINDEHGVNRARLEMASKAAHLDIALGETEVGIGAIDTL